MPAAAKGLELLVLASGSKGNASVLRDTASKRAILIDCGISKKGFLQRCETLGFDPREIEAVLVTHEHTDHTKGLGVLYRGFAKLGMAPTLYTGAKILAASAQVQQATEHCDVRFIDDGSDESVAGMAVHAFATSHDAVQSFGFRFDGRSDSIGFMTDTGIVTPQALEALRECRVLGIESNHDARMLKYGPYPARLKARIASARGHLSNEQSAGALEELASDRLEEVVALHVSENNNDYLLPEKSLEQTLALLSHPARVHVGFQHTPIRVS
ncbi:MAG: MBL fold metallo-hydrolase [Coriobacteriaceae bacterium]|nr:MBL fold metallo-hydrolase [Coriobacteriaceae bacterium]